MQSRKIADLASFDLQRLRLRDQLKAQYKIGGAQALPPMALGALERAELGLEGIAQSVPGLRSAADFLNAIRMESGWRHEATWPRDCDLSSYERREYSQNGEDGILERIFDQIGTTNRSFVEIGASDGEENCTRNLLESGWTGIWVEAERERADHARRVAAQRAVVVGAPAEPATIGTVLRRAGVPAEPDLVVLDIDGNDWWVLFAVLLDVAPRVLVVEYNSTYRPGRWWVEPYREGLTWDHSVRHGASLGAIASLAATFGLTLVGCDSTGVNSFFIDHEVLSSRSLEAPGPIDSLYRGPWFAPGLWGHPRQRNAGANTPSLRPLGDRELHRISLQAKRWPGSAARPLAAGQPVVVQATVRNGTDELLTSEGSTPLQLALRWRRSNDPATLWSDEPRIKLWPIRPNQIGRTRLWSRAPSFAGTYRLELSLVQENVRWLDA
ncbi:MAG TPA: hypothetical protein VMF65_21180, partial [Acidimicrobiales bacterium]|nr:hypothetical protein [Acidimicrobiales bacterium]